MSPKDYHAAVHADLVAATRKRYEEHAKDYHGISIDKFVRAVDLIGKALQDGMGEKIPLAHMIMALELYFKVTQEMLNVLQKQNEVKREERDIGGAG